MKTLLRKFAQPLLKIFEAGDEPYNYKSSHRTILKMVGGLFLILSTVSGVAAFYSGQLGGLLPCLIFGVIGGTCMVVGFLGTDRAVAKMWGSR